MIVLPNWKHTFATAAGGSFPRFGRSGDRRGGTAALDAQPPVSERQACSSGSRRFRQYVAPLVEVAKEAHRVSQARNYNAFLDISDKMNDGCANCHKVYRDKGGTEESAGPPMSAITERTSRLHDRNFCCADVFF